MVRYDLFCKNKEQEIFLWEYREVNVYNMYNFLDSMQLTLICYYVDPYSLLNSA